MANPTICLVTVEDHGECAVLGVTGEVDVATSPLLRDALLDPQLDATGLLVVDMEAVTFLDSTGLSALVAGHKRFDRAGGALHIVVDHPHVMRVLEVTGLHEALSIFPDVETACTATAA